MKWLTYLNEPVNFVHDFFQFPPNEYPAPYQEESLHKLIEVKRVCLRGPHGLGKTALMAWSSIWFGVTRPVDTKIPMTASAWRQLEKYLWPEIHKWYNLCDWAKWVEYGGLVPELFTLKMKIGTQCEAFALASDNEALIEGAHGTNLFYVFDESKAIPAKTWDAAEGAFATGDAYWLSASTPGGRFGRFYDIQRKAPGFEDWWVRHVKLDEAIEAGRINPEWADARKRQWGEDSAVYQARVLGEFPEQSEDSLISLTWVTDARDKNIFEPGDPHIISVDIARYGDDDSAMFERKGKCIVNGTWWHGHDTMYSAGRVKATGIPANVDEIGMGSGVVDRLKEQKYPVRGINVSHAAIDKEHFRNLRAELYWILREEFRAGTIDLSRLPQHVYDRLSGELTSIKFKYTSKGQIQVQSKEEIKKNLGFSPDLADALMMSYAPEKKKAKVMRLVG